MYILYIYILSIYIYINIYKQIKTNASICAHFPKLYKYIKIRLLQFLSKKTKC